MALGFSQLTIALVQPCTLGEMREVSTSEALTLNVTIELGVTWGILQALDAQIGQAKGVEMKLGKQHIGIESSRSGSIVAL